MNKSMMLANKKMLIPQEELALLEAEAEIILRSGMYPLPIDKLKLIIIKGYRLGFSPTEAVSRIVETNGKLTIDGQGMLAIVMSSGLLEDIRVEEGKNYCKIGLKRKGISSYVSGVFSLEDAEQAGLLQRRGPWQQYTKQMLYWRAFSMAARRLFADIIMGLYTTEEMENSWQGDASVEIPEPLDDTIFIDQDDDAPVAPPVETALQFLQKHVRLYGVNDEGASFVMDEPQTSIFWQDYLEKEYGNLDVDEKTLHKEKNKLFAYLIEQRRPIILQALERGFTLIKREKKNAGLAVQTVLGQAIVNWTYSQIYGEPIPQLEEIFNMELYKNWKNRYADLQLVAQPLQISANTYMLRIIGTWPRRETTIENTTEIEETEKPLTGKALLDAYFDDDVSE